MAIFEEDVPISFYAHIQQIKDGIRDLLNNTPGTTVSDITDDEMDKLLSFLHETDKVLEEYPDPEDRCNRLRNLAITLYALLLKGDRDDV